MRKSMFFSGKAVQQTSKQSGLVVGFYYVVEFRQLSVVGIFGSFTQTFNRLLRVFYSAKITGFISVINVFIHQIHKTYNNELQIKLINS